ncbi:MAG: hypothetical protein IKO42_07280 [Opitutales bacterium]|nr:hypothetical protein [Opitutales bacterium]
MICSTAILRIIFQTIAKLISANTSVAKLDIPKICPADENKIAGVEAIIPILSELKIRGFFMTLRASKWVGIKIENTIIALETAARAKLKSGRK